MPSKSKKQHNLMALVANDPKAAKRLGIPKSVGEEFMSADKGKKFKEGGMMDKEDLKQDKKMAKKAIGMHEKQLHGGKKSDLAALKKGGMCKGYAEGGRIAAKGEHPVQKQSKRGAQMFKKGGIVEKDSGEKYTSKAAMMKHEKKESKAEEMKEHRMKKGGSCKYARGGGIEVRGKTKGKII